MALIAVVCPDCQSDEAVVKNGKSAAGKQRLKKLAALKAVNEPLLHQPNPLQVNYRGRSSQA